MVADVDNWQSVKVDYHTQVENSLCSVEGSKVGYIEEYVVNPVFLAR